MDLTNFNVGKTNVEHLLIWYVSVGWRLDHTINFILIQSLNVYVVKAKALIFNFSEYGGSMYCIMVLGLIMLYLV